MTNLPPSTKPAGPPDWELGAEAIAVRIRWFGLVLGYVYVNLGPAGGDQFLLNAILALGAGFTILDTIHSWRGKIFLAEYPLSISLLEAVFIGLLCYFDTGLQSPFRFYYLLSLICCSIRHTQRLTYLTCALDCLSYGALYLATPDPERDPLALAWMVILLMWVSWASSALAGLLKRAGSNLTRLNAELEGRIEDRSRELRDAQAMVLHQEKMAGFGLLAAGIAHEVGNPLTSISSLVQMLQRRDIDGYTSEKLALVGGQLQRIQTTLRELVDFSRPASSERGRFAIAGVIREALSIAKYYKGTKSRRVTTDFPDDLPLLEGVRDQLVQVFFNLIVNAIDATGKTGSIEIVARNDGPDLVVTLGDDGPGIDPAHQGRLFQPYFTTKRQGTGLGLFVTRKLVEHHGGRVEFETRPGSGTTFRIRLPAARPYHPGVL